MNDRSSAPYSVGKLERDIVRTSIDGDLDGPALEAFFAEIASAGASSCYVTICDISRMGEISAEARRVAKSMPELMPGFRAVLIHGGGFMQRLVAKLVLNATNLIARRPIHFHFCADETAALEAARRLLPELRGEGAE